MSKNISICIECESEYFTKSSKMNGLCVECSHQLYDYKNCAHEFNNGRCTKCYWNGNTSEYIKNRQS